MISLENFKKQMTLIATNYQLQVDSSYLNLILVVLQKHNISDTELANACNKMVEEVTYEEFKSRYGYNNMPTAADWLKLCKSKNNTDDAEYQVELILSEAEGYSSKLPTFSNKITEDVSKRHFQRIKWDLDKTNYQKKERHFVKKELKEIWIATKDRIDNQANELKTGIESNKKDIALLINNLFKKKNAQ